MISLIDNAALQGMLYGVAVLGLVFSFRVAKYPDLSADGSFLLGAVTYVACISAGWHWVASLILASLAGSSIGFVAAAMHFYLGVNKLLTGILSSMASYSIAFRLLGSRPNVGLENAETIFTASSAFDRSLNWDSTHPLTIAICLGVVVTLMYLGTFLLRTDFGLYLRASGSNPERVKEAGRSPSLFVILTLMISNGVIGLSGGLVASNEGFVDLNMGTGLIVTLIAALILGEQMMRSLGFELVSNPLARAIAAIAGSFAYFFLYLAILRGSLSGWLPFEVEPTDLKILSAAVIVIAIVARARLRRAGINEDVIPF